jgi:GTP-binding protein
MSDEKTGELNEAGQSAADKAAADQAANDARMREAGRLLFAGECDFFWAASKIDGLPPEAQPEIAFAGRSNVGKSSLLNALTNRKTLARTSNTPGRTQQLNFFALGGPIGAERMRLIDMPGYGYAAASKEKISSWTRLMEGYLRGRATLARVFVLVDGRHGLKDVDREMFDLLDRAAVSYQVVLTKRDEVKISEREDRIASTLEGLRKRPAAFPHVIFTSSKDGDGIPELRGAVAQLMANIGKL